MTCRHKHRLSDWSRTRRPGTDYGARSAVSRSADVVLYDHLVHPRLLRHARPDAEKIDVGTAAPQPLEQEAICYLLAEKAREGKIVARLKWGDPFVFDRGGAEALFLHEQGVRFEVVPGVPAGIGFSSYAGVPLTYPGAGDTARASSAGYEDDGKARAPIDVDWSAWRGSMAPSSATPGPAQLPQMVATRCSSHGRDADEPAALVFNGTLASADHRRHARRHRARR